MRPRTYNPSIMSPSKGKGVMTTEEFRRAGKEMIDYIIKYTQDVRTLRVLPDVQPNYLQEIIPNSPPESREDWANVLHDFEEHIMTGLAHWIHPKYFANFPNGRSYSSILGETLSSGLDGVGFNWISDPAMTELEIVVLDWFGQALGLPRQFLHSYGKKKGGGCFQPSASDCVLVAMMGARYASVQRIRDEPATRRLRMTDGTRRRGDRTDADCAALQRLVVYCSREAHICVEKAAKICLLRLHILPVDSERSLRGDTLRKAMDQDERAGLVPCMVVATLGTPSTCAFDNLHELATECHRRPDVWLHVDAAYAGNTLLCPEFKYLGEGLEYANSINVSAHKLLPVNFDCACFWLRDYVHFVEGFIVDTLYLQHEHDDVAIDFRHWGIPLSRRFRALKLWFTMRTFGITGLQEQVYKHCRLARQFADLVDRDSRFRLMNDVKVGVVCFRLESLGMPLECQRDHLTELLLAFLNASGRTCFSPVEINELFCIRFCVVSALTTESDIESTWLLIDECVGHIETSLRSEPSKRPSKLSDYEEQVGLLRFLTGTVTAPPARYRRLKAAVGLRDDWGPYLMPDADDRVAEIFNLSHLSDAYWRP